MPKKGLAGVGKKFYNEKMSKATAKVAHTKESSGSDKESDITSTGPEEAIEINKPELVDEPAVDAKTDRKPPMTMHEFGIHSEKLARPKDEGRGFKKQLSLGQFITSMMLIMVVGLGFIGGMYYLVNQDYLFKGPKYQNPVTTEPVSLYLDVGQPETDSLSTSSTTIVSGKTIPSATVAIISQSQNVILSANEVGEFSKILPLDKGLNVIQVSAFDERGNSKNEILKIYYTDETIDQ